MKAFVGTKAIKAKPLNREDYTAMRGWTLPEDEDGADEGYLVEYADGYISWSPKGTFEEAYSEVGDRVTLEEVNAAMAKVETIQHSPNTSITTVTMTNGYTILESSACVDPSNFDLATGEEINLNKIRDEIWKLLGYELKQKHFLLNSLK